MTPDKTPKNSQPAPSSLPVVFRFETQHNTPPRYTELLPQRRFFSSFSSCLLMFVVQCRSSLRGPGPGQDMIPGRIVERTPGPMLACLLLSPAGCLLETAREPTNQPTNQRSRTKTATAQSRSGPETPGTLLPESEGAARTRGRPDPEARNKHPSHRAR